MRRPLIVTTRSRLRSSLLFPLMHGATRRVLRDLAGTDGAERVVSIVAGRHEFWSVSVWSSRFLMQEFVRSGSHGSYLWEVSRWLDSFWLARWRAVEPEVGTWDGRRLSAADPSGPQPDPSVDTALRDRVLRDIPSLRLAFGPHGAPDQEHALEARLDRALVEGAAGVLVQVAGRDPRPAAARRRLRELHGHVSEQPDVLRTVVGAGQHGGAYLLAVCADPDVAAATVQGPTLTALVERYGARVWATCLLPDNEFGHWDGLRLRDLGLQGQLGRGADAPENAS